MASIETDFTMDSIIEKFAISLKVPTFISKILVPIINNFTLLFEYILYIYYLVQFKKN